MYIDSETACACVITNRVLVNPNIFYSSLISFFADSETSIK